MFSLFITGRPPGQQVRLNHALRAMMMIWLLMLGVVPAALLGTPVTRAHTTDAATDLAVMRDSPAVVRIITEVAGALICHACAADGSDIISPQDPNQQPFIWAWTGSGAFISPDGYILTAAHVADYGPDSPGAALVLPLAAQDIGQRYHADPNSVLAFLENHPNQVQVVTQLVKQVVFLTTAYTGQLQNTAQVLSYPVTRTVVSSPYGQQDTAIMKVAAQDMPNLTLADASDVTTGETITSIAFPHGADLVANGKPILLNPAQSDAETLSGLLTPTVETGQITAQKTVGGTLYYETSAIANHGSSGGSVIDTQGRVIGFNDSISDTGRVTNLISSSVPAQYVRQAGVTNSGQGAFEALWTKAVNEYYAGGCQLTNAVNDLNKLHENYQAFGGGEPLLKDTQAKATPDGCAPSSANLLLIGAIGGGLVLVIAITLSVLLLVKRRGQLQSIQRQSAWAMNQRLLCCLAHCHKQTFLYRPLLLFTSLELATPIAPAQAARKPRHRQQGTSTQDQGILLVRQSTSNRQRPLRWCVPTDMLSQKLALSSARTAARLYRAYYISRAMMTYFAA